MIYGGISGFITGLLIKLFWINMHQTPAMLYMLILDQMDVFPMIAKGYHLSEREILSLVHFITAILFGALFAILFHRLVKSIWNGLGIGFMFGVIWWLLTPFYLLPFFFVIDPNVRWKDLTMYELLQSLTSHILFGLLLGLIYALLCKLLRKQARNG